jgi:hypothetical protein
MILKMDVKATINVPREVHLIISIINSLMNFNDTSSLKIYNPSKSYLFIYLFIIFIIEIFK